MIYAKRGPVVRTAYLCISCMGYVFTGFGRLFAGRRIVLCYHGIAAGQAGRFRSQMEHLRRSRRAPAIGLTFDDAFENLLENALPVLDEFDISAVVFAVPGNLGRTPQWRISPGHPEYGERIMTAEQLRRIADRNITIGSHTQTHPALPELSREQIRRELAESKRNLEELIGRPVVDLALPHGACNDVVLDVAREVGYSRVYTLEPRMHGPQGQDDVMGRFSMSPDVWPIEFRLTCAGAYAWLGPWRSFARAVRRRIFRK